MVLQVGLLEHLQESLAVLEARLPAWFTGVTKLYNGSVANRNSVGGGPGGVSPQARAVLRDRLGPEYELYNHIKQKLFKQYADITGSKVTKIDGI